MVASKHIRSFDWIGAAFAMVLATVSYVRASCPPDHVELGLPVHITVGTAPTGCVAGDFNGDGILDIAVAVSRLTMGTVPGDVVVMLGNGSDHVGDGTFGAPIGYPGGDNPFDIVAGDFTGDGILDLVVSNETSVYLRLLRGLGTGAFSSPTYIAAGANPHHILTADFNEDGILDLAAACNGAAIVSVVLGHGANGEGDGTFFPAVQYTTSGNNTGIDVADIDEDGILDLVVASYAGGTVDILLGKGTAGAGDGTFHPATHVAGVGIPYDVTAADATGDGHVDLVVGRDGGGGVALYRGNGSGSFAAPTYPFATGNLAAHVVADFDGDGVMDLLSAQTSLDRVALLHGLGGGSFELRSQRLVSDFPVFMDVGDFNGDAAPDVVVSNYHSSVVSVLLNSCAALPTVFALQRIRDVPNDQGGKVWLTWPAHDLDVAGGSITGYRVWRRIPAAAAAGAAEKGALRTSPSATDVVYWEAAATLPAQHLEAYGYTAETPQDSLAGSNPYTAFFITATTSSASTFYDTAVDSGYSVDNLAPAAPTQIQAQYGGGEVAMSWAPNAESDLYGYRVHRGADRFFVPTPTNLVGQPLVPAFIDPANEAWFYKIAGVDVHGNVGAFALVEPEAPVGVDVAFVSFEVVPGGITLVWYADAHAVPVATLQRDDGDGAWHDIGQGVPDAGGRLVFHDPDVAPGASYSYRLRWITQQGERTTASALVAVPALALALEGARPNPSERARLAIHFSLPDAAPAMLELFDVTGRRVLRRDVGALGAGPHVLDLASAKLRGGVYLARLSQGGTQRSVRIVVL